MAFVPLHQHLLIKAVTTSPITDETTAKKMLTTLVNKLGMKPVTEPQAIYVSEEGNEGLTGSINLATSHIAFHVWDKTGLLMMDVYSCKEFEVEPLIEYLHRLWSLSEVLYTVIDRDKERNYSQGIYYNET